MEDSVSENKLVIQIVRLCLWKESRTDVIQGEKESVATMVMREISKPITLSLLFRCRVRRCSKTPSLNSVRDE